MRQLSLLLCAGLVTLGAFAACSGDDGSKKVQDGEAGAGGAEAGRGGDVNGGSSSNPRAGEGGAPTTAGQGGTSAGAPPLGMAGEGGHGGVPSSAGAAGGGGEGGEPPACPAEPGSFTYSCGIITELFTPTFDTTTAEMSLDIPSLQFPIESGTVSFFYENADATQCGATDLVEGMGTNVTANLNLLFTPGVIRISAFDFVDACGSHHVFDQTGVPSCYELTGTGGEGSIPLECQGTFSVNCPAACE